MTNRLVGRFLSLRERNVEGSPQVSCGAATSISLGLTPQANRCRPSGTGCRSGVTLLELLLALSLLSLVIAAITMAINTALFTLNTHRTGIEEAQLARALLSRISGDLRSAIAFRNTDFSGVADLAGTSAEGLFDNEATAEAAEEQGVDEEDADTVQDVVATLAPATVPGVYGNRYQMQVDISRLPRIEEFDPALQLAGEQVDLPSDAKTVAYYLSANTEDEESTAGSTAAAATGGGFAMGRGLVRRSLDRSTTQWAVDNGDFTRLDGSGELLAIEVVALEFRYFDGEQWLDVWNTEENGGLPVAVHVALAIESANEPAEEESNDAEAVPAALISENTAEAEVIAPPPLVDSRYLIYHQVIRIPSGEPTFDEEAIETDEQ